MNVNTSYPHDKRERSNSNLFYEPLLTLCSKMSVSFRGITFLPSSEKNPEFYCFIRVPCKLWQEGFFFGCSWDWLIMLFLLFSAQFVDYTIWSECCLLRSCHGNPKIHLPSPSAALPSVPTTLLQLPALGAKPRNQDSNILFLVSLTLDERPGMIQEFYPSPWI